MLGYYALGPFVQHEVIDSGVHTQKFAAAVPRLSPSARSSAIKMADEELRVGTWQWNRAQARKEGGAAVAEKKAVATDSKLAPGLEFSPYYDMSTM